MQACAVFPLFVDTRPAGVMYFFFGRAVQLDDEMATLWAGSPKTSRSVSARWSGNSRRRLAEAHRERLTRMFAALGATNEAIMRAKTRQELFRQVCEAAVVGGKFTSTAIALARPDSDYLETVAAAGPDRDRARHVRLFDQRGSSGRAGHHRHRVPVA